MKVTKNADILDELSKGCFMGMDALNYILEKVDDKIFREVLENQYDDYKKVSEKIEEIYPDYSSKEPHETSKANKAMTWYTVQMKTITDSSTSKLAEILLQGTNMGIIEGRKLLNNKEADKRIISLIEEYIKMQEKAVEKLKKFL